MTLQPFEQVLIEGGRRELLKFGSCEHCVVVDWRDDMETVLDAVKMKLPNGYLEYRSVDGQVWELRCHGVVHGVTAPKAGANTEPLLQAINRALLPEYEMRIFTPTMGDGYSLLLRPAMWWSEFSAAYPALARKLFVTIDSRVARVGAGETQTTLTRLAQNWMSLRGWQRGVLGTLVIIGSLGIILCVVTFFVMLLQ